jgi:hypothetical protein
MKDEFFHRYVLRDNGILTGVVSGTDFNSEEGYCIWNLGIDSTLKSDLKYRSILKYILFELFSFLGLLEILTKVPKHLRSIVDWHIRWSFKKVDFSEKKGCYNLSLD